MKCNYCQKDIVNKEVEIKHALLVELIDIQEKDTLPPLSTIRSAEKLFVKKRRRRK